MTTLNLTEIVGEPSSWTLKNGPAAGQEMLTFTVKDDQGTTYQINRKPTSGPPQLGPDEFEITPPKQGTTFPPKLKRLQSGGQAPQNASQDSSDTPSPEFWRARDKRIARAGIVQAIIAASDLPEKVEHIPLWVESLNAMADAVLASLDERTPHPNDAGLGGGSPPVQPAVESSGPRGRAAQEGRSENWAEGVSTLARTMPGGDLALPPEPPRGFASTSQQDTFQRLLKSNGLDHANLMTVMAYAESLPTPAISIAIDGLRDNADDMCSRLLEASGKWAKESDFVPADTTDLPPTEQVGIGAADDDIPFAPSVI